MKKILTLLLISCSFITYSQTILNTSFEKNRTIEIENKELVDHFSINGKVELKGSNALVRVVLELNDGRELLVYETYPLIANSNSFSFQNACEETYSFKEGKLSNIKVVVIDANLTLNDYSTKVISGKSTISNQEILKTKIKQINTNLRKQGALWVAGETSVSKLSYAEKKKLFNSENFPNIQGIEYYKGGIIDMRMYSEKDASPKTKGVTLKADQYVPWVDEFSYIDLHGANDINSAYYNSDITEQGWITSVKDQGLAGACWAFSAVASLEARANLYYNKHLHLDLSEQQLISCSKQGTTNGGFADQALQWLAIHGSVSEECFPYQASDVDSSLICSNPQENIIPEGVAWYNHYDYVAHEGGLKRMLINKSPISINVSTWSHALLLVGYKTLNIGVEVLLPVDGNIQNGLDTVVIADTSDILGQTCWKIKNSWGADWGDDGYFDMIFDDYEPIYRSSAPTGKLSSLNLTDDDIACFDKDGDGYYNWGVGERPRHCPNNLKPDGDDNNPLYGPRDDYGNPTLIGALNAVEINGDNPIVTTATYTLSGLPTGAVFSHWSYSSNLTSTDYQATTLDVSIKEDNGLASITCHFTYNNKDFKITKIVSTSENQIVFVEQNNNFPASVASSIFIADVDMDEDYDLLYSGRTHYDYAQELQGEESPFSISLFENNSSFVRATPSSSLKPFVYHHYNVVFNDFNNDFIPDLFCDQKIYFSNQSNPFDSLEEISPLPGVYNVDKWYDINNDGILDGCNLYYGKFMTYHKTYLTKNYPSSYNFADINNDGINEIISMPVGFSEHATYHHDSSIYVYDIKNSDDSLKVVSKTKLLIPSGLLSLASLPTFEIADFNNDGFIDLISAYYVDDGEYIRGILTVYLNDQDNGFNPVPISVSGSFPDGLRNSIYALGDYTNDNFIDIIYSGHTPYDNNIRRTYLLINDGTGKFNSTIINIGGVEHNYASLNVADFDNDNNLDFLISGANGLYMSCGAGKTEIMLNKGSFPEMLPPVAPTNLNVVDTIEGQYTFKWDKLAEGGYSYNIKIGTTSGGGEIVTCNASMSGKLTVPQMGHAGLSGMYFLERNLPPGTYFWTVQAIDNAYRGGEFATVQEFTINAAPEILPQSFNVPENSMKGFKIGKIYATDFDSENLNYFAIDEMLKDTIAVDELTGEITIADSVLFNYESNSVFKFIAQVTDGELYDTAWITINITDVNESPEIEDHSFTIEEGLPNGSIVGTVTANDVDSDELFYSITDGNSTNTFMIDNITGEITVSDNTALDFETIPSFVLLIEVGDGSLSNNANITINLTDVVETSVNNYTDDEIIIKPNPASEFVIFEIKAGKKVWLEIYNIKGELVFSQEIRQSDRISINQLKNGIYTCKIRIDGRISTKKLLIQR